jgi:hypothetical protein
MVADGDSPHGGTSTHSETPTNMSLRIQELESIVTTLMADRNPKNLQDEVDSQDAFALIEAPDKVQLNKCLDEFQDVFRAQVAEHLPPRRGIEHEIETGDTHPVNTRAYPLSFQQLKEQTKQVTKLLEKGLIRESSSSWGSPVLFVKKPDGGWRMCVDYGNSMQDKKEYLSVTRYSGMYRSVRQSDTFHQARSHCCISLYICNRQGCHRVRQCGIPCPTRIAGRISEMSKNAQSCHLRIFR